MLAWIRTPRGSTMTATAAAALLALFFLAPWSRPLPFHSPFGRSGDAPVSDVSSPPPATDTAKPDPVPAQVASLQPRQSQAGEATPTATPPTSAPPPSAPPPSSAAGTVPSFDVVRVQPSGDAVIAGRAPPNSHVSLMDGDKVLATVTVDGTGQFALLPSAALTPGQHYLTLRRDGDATGSETVSTQGVAVSVAEKGDAKPLVALLSPDKPAEILSDGAPLGAGTAGASPAAVAASPVAIQSVQAQEGGRFFASGVAHAGNQCRLYLNGAFLADVTAGRDGKWSVEVAKGMQPGRYTVRADELEASSGKVLHRAEVPFDYPAVLAKGTTSPMRGGVGTGSDGATALANGTGSQIVIADLHTTKVMAGDSLWRISRKLLGRGIQYTEIYASNVSQIRNPKLIYPGQVFVLPTARKVN